MLSEELINDFKRVIRQNDKGHFPLSCRVKLMKDVKDVSIINKIFFECIKYIIESKKSEFSKNQSVNLVLEKVNNFLYFNKGDKTEIENIIENYRNYFEDMEDMMGLLGFSIISLCNSIIYEASLIIEIDEYMDQDDDYFDWEVWNTDFYTSMIFSGGNPFLGKGDKEKRKLFWIWYLDTVYALSMSPNKPLLPFVFSPSIENDIPYIKRIQTYQTPSILEKIKEVIENAVRSYHKDYVEIWEKIFIDAYCMKAGLYVSTYFNKDGNFFKIKGNFNSFDLMNEIKYEMYEQAKKEGAWFFSRIEVLHDLSYIIDFNYDYKDDLPEERFKSPDNFIYEFKYFPRNKDFTPLWWQDILGKKAKYLN